jgi:hypothetical protein
LEISRRAAIFRSPALRTCLSTQETAIKIKAKFWIEFEVEDNSNPRHTLKRALTRAERGLKEIIEEGKPGSGARTGIKRNSTKIEVKSRFIE